MTQTDKSERKYIEGLIDEVYQKVIFPTHHKFFVDQTSRFTGKNREYEQRKLEIIKSIWFGNRIELPPKNLERLATMVTDAKLPKIIDEWTSRFSPNLNHRFCGYDHGKEYAKLTHQSNDLTISTTHIKNWEFDWESFLEETQRQIDPYDFQKGTAYFGEIANNNDCVKVVIHRKNVSVNDFVTSKLHEITPQFIHSLTYNLSLERYEPNEEVSKYIQNSLPQTCDNNLCSLFFGTKNNATFRILVQQPIIVEKSAYLSDLMTIKLAEALYFSEKNDTKRFLPHEFTVDLYSLPMEEKQCLALQFLVQGLIVVYQNSYIRHATSRNADDSLRMDKSTGRRTKGTYNYPTKYTSHYQIPTEEDYKQVCKKKKELAKKREKLEIIYYRM